MKPNTPTKITRMIHITTWCSQSISAAIFDAGVWKYQAIACADPDAATAMTPVKSAVSVEMSLLTFMFQSPNKSVGVFFFRAESLRVRQVRRDQQQHFEPRKRQHQPCAHRGEPRADYQHHRCQRRIHLRQASRRHRAIALHLGTRKYHIRRVSLKACA